MHEDFTPLLSVVDLAKQILQMNNTILQQKEELERLKGYEKKYNDLLNDSLSHSKTMIGNTVKMLMVPGVGEVFAKNAKAESFSGAEHAPEKKPTNSSYENGPAVDTLQQEQERQWLVNELSQDIPKEQKVVSNDDLLEGYPKTDTQNFNEMSDDEYLSRVISNPRYQTQKLPDEMTPDDLSYGGL